MQTLKMRNMNLTSGGLTGKVVVITGATSGIGLAAAERFAQEGAFVIGIGRSEDKICLALNRVRKSSPKGEAEYVRADLADQFQVRDLGNSIGEILVKNRYDHVDVLINNAGVYLERRHMTANAIEMTFAVNHLAAFTLTYVLLPYLKRAKKGCVMTISSYAHRTTPLCLKRIANPLPYLGLLAYKRSKLCNILFTTEFNRRVNNILAYAVDPGLVNTGIASKGDPGISEWVWRKRRQKGMRADDSVETLLFLVHNAQKNTADAFYFRGCRAEKPSRNARRSDLAETLWHLSCQLTQLDWS
jgi:retinol dehydrogenase 12